MIRFVLIALVSFFISMSDIYGQNSIELFKIRHVKIEGNEKTKDFVILKQIPVSFGDTLTQKKIEYFTDRVYSLGLFTSVSYRLDFNSDTKDNDLVIIVHEKWYWLVYPVVRFKESNISRFIQNPSGTKIQYGFGGSHMNFLGRRISLRMLAVVGYDLNLGFYFNNPHSFLDDNLSFGGSVSYQEVHNQNTYLIESDGEFIRKIRSVTHNYGYSFSPYLNSGITLYYNSISNSSLGNLNTEKEIVLNPNGTADENFGLGFSLVYDTRDIYEFPMSGIYASSNLSYSQELNTSTHYETSKIDLRYYYPVKDGLTVAGNFIHQKYYGELIPYYDHFNTGKDEVVRGFENQLIESVHRIISRYEIRKELIPASTEVFDWIPWEQFKYFRWAVFGYVYSDITYNFLPDSIYKGLNSYIESNNLLNYYDHLLSNFGIGMHISLPYGNSLRFEYNYNSFHQQSFWINSTRPF